MRVVGGKEGKAATPAARAHPPEHLASPARCRLTSAAMSAEKRLFIYKNEPGSEGKVCALDSFLSLSTKGRHSILPPHPYSMCHVG